MVVAVAVQQLQEVTVLVVQVEALPLIQAHQLVARLILVAVAVAELMLVQVAQVVAVL